MTNQKKYDPSHPLANAKWKSSKEYPEALGVFKDQCNISILSRDICQFFSDTLAPGVFDSSPLAIDIFMDGSFSHNFEIATDCLRYSLRKLGYALKVNTAGDKLFYRLTNKSLTGGRVLNVSAIDLKTFDGTYSGIIPKMLLSTRQSWPGICIIWLLALNPHICIKLGVKDLPELLIPGINSKSGHMPKVYTFEKTVYIDCDWDPSTIQYAVLPAFR